MYCLGKRSGETVKEYIELIRKNVDPRAKVTLGAIPYQENQVMYLCADISRLTAETGFVPETSFEEGSGRPSDGAGSNAAYESKKNMEFYYPHASIIVTILTGLLYTPVMLRLLGQNEYGIYQLANSLVTYLSLLNLGLNGSYIKFYMREKVKGDKEGVAERQRNVSVAFFGNLNIRCYRRNDSGMQCAIGGEIAIRKKKLG